MLTDTKLFRLAINTQMVVESCNSKPNIPFLSRYPDYVGSNEELKEWTLSMNRGGIIDLNESEELNEIVTLSLGYPVSRMDKYATNVLIDINTIPEKKNYRFVPRDMEVFSTYVSEKVLKVTKELEEVIEHGK